MQFCADLSKKSKSIKPISIYASENSRYPLSEKGIFIMLWLTVLEILDISINKRLTFLDNLRAVTHEGNVETRQTIPFFYLLFVL